MKNYSNYLDYHFKTVIYFPFFNFVDAARSSKYPDIPNRKMSYLTNLKRFDEVRLIELRLLVKLKKMIFMISQNVPFTINISKISELIGVSRPTLLQVLFLLEKARVIALVNKPNKEIGILTKPEKIYLNNTNLAYALADGGVDVGNTRETFFVNQLKATHQLHLSDTADFIVDRKYTFEIGGKNKKKKQIQGIEDAYIAKDSIEIGTGNCVPLYLFGLLY
jgi:uncharacterized protein